MLSTKKNLIQFLRKTSFIRARFISAIPSSSVTVPNPSWPDGSLLDKSLYATGLLNWLWDSWNNYCRTWWLIHLCGGKNKYGVFVGPIHSSNTSQSLYYMLHLAGKRSKPTGVVTGTYQEATWGDPNIIAKMASNLPSLGITPLSLLTSFGQGIKHLQLTRNSAIHPSSSSINQFHSEVIPFYSGANIKYPTDILLSTELTTRRPAILFWLEELEGFAVSLI